MLNHIAIRWHVGSCAAIVFRGNQTAASWAALLFLDVSGACGLETEFLTGDGADMVYHSLEVIREFAVKDLDTGSKFAFRIAL